MTSNNQTSNHNEGYEGKSDHEVILILETQVQDLMNNLDKSERDRSALVKLQGQVGIVRLVFAGICGLLLATLITAVASWYTPKANLSTEKVIALAERILLVLTGILSSVVAGFGDNRNGGEG